MTMGTFQGQATTSSVQSLAIGGNTAGSVGIRQQTSISPVTAARQQITTQQVGQGTS